MAVSAGDRLGRYEILAPIGAGGMGEVYRALDPRLEREVALKVLPAETLTDRPARTRMLREARMAAKLNHPHVCTVHEVGEADGQVFIAMELVAGQSLAETLAGGRLFLMAPEEDPSDAPAYEGLAWVWAARRQGGITAPDVADPRQRPRPYRRSRCMCSGCRQPAADGSGKRSPR